ncbi:hypothetical protein L1987_46014 [Smallanthus sonchifolius]|uniref:Uncharacterized protein n=1 Tax=Smallanthus sonchifolius TaxID=185202 RepID=A0ACB9FZ42_9ASTR|nr:hypothetical protein L1987_46014 [Smallanthus sonchifolius]
MLEMVFEVDDDVNGEVLVNSADPEGRAVDDDGMEFESEAAAHAFYNAYATRVGFVISVSKLSRSRRDGTAIGRALGCNKESFRMPDKREKVVRQRRKQGSVVEQWF